MPDYKEKIAEMAAEEKKQGRIDYQNTAFILQKPYSTQIIEGPLRLKDRNEHKKLVERAKSKGLYVWYASIVEYNGRKCMSHQSLIDWDSVPEPGKKPADKKSEDDPVAGQSSHFRCGECGKVCSSSSGLTLHRKRHD